jgi:16S rRNA (cytosine967-C5)-methyltransferase
VQALLFHVLRHWGLAQSVRALLVQKPPSTDVDAHLCAALALCGPVDAPLYDGFTLVNQAVEASKHSPVLRRHTAFFNGCLRRFLREQPQLLQQARLHEPGLWSYPQWWIDKVRQDYPHEWRSVLEAGNRQPALTLRVNIQQHTRDQFQARLQQANVEALCNGAAGLTLKQPMPVHQIPGFTQGAASVQDAAAQLAAPLLWAACIGQAKVQHQGNKGGLKILDACAAPGGKTAHLLELGGVQVTALELDAARARRIQENLDRLGLTARVLVGDAREPTNWWDGGIFDGILLDAPCTASGIVRRHPDVRWLRRPADITQMSVVQSQLLHSLWPLLAVHGHLLYCTCSIFKEEGEQQVQTFLEHNTSARLLPSVGHLTPKSNLEPVKLGQNEAIDHDGFYYALLQKVPVANL